MFKKLYKSNGKKENVLTGALGALFFSLLCTSLWLLLFRFAPRPLVGASTPIAFASIMCALIGYKMLGNRLTLKGVIISTVICVLMLVLIWHIGLAIELCKFVEKNYNKGTISFKVSFYDALGNPYYWFKVQANYAWRRIGDLVAGLFVCISGGVIYGKDARKSNRELEEYFDYMNNRYT